MSDTQHRTPSTSAFSRRIGRYGSALALAMGVTALSSSLQAAPELRFQVDQKGDIAIVGNTLGYDCRNGTPPTVVGSAPLEAQCGTGTSDSAPDLFWRSDEPGDGEATASLTITNANARSTAVLGLPGGAQVTYARLYWAALRSGPGADESVLFERPGVFSTTLTVPPEPEENPYTISVGGGMTKYESSIDVTSLVRTHGNGAYRIGEVEAVALPNLNDARAFAAWSLVVVYEDATQPLRQLSVFDGLTAAGGSGVTFNISGFLVPNKPSPSAKIGVVAYGGDGLTSADSLSFNAQDLVDGVGPVNNFFNSSRTNSGSAVSVAGDLPQLSGGMRSMAGVDMDIVDVSTLVTANDTDADIGLKAGGDNEILLGVLCTSIETFKPNFNDSIKTAGDVNGGSLVVGDEILYTINVVNTGNDPALEVELTDAIPSGFTYKPDSLMVAGVSKTDDEGDDEAEFDVGLNEVRARLGTGADEVLGGTLGIGESVIVTFVVTVDPGASGTISNQATIRASGEAGASETDFETQNNSGPGSTDVVVDACDGPEDCPGQHCFDAPASSPNECVDCLSSDDCTGPTQPICDTSAHTCEQCASDTECEGKDSDYPACQLSGTQDGACTQCSDTVDSECTGTTRPICVTSIGSCGCEDDSDCGADDSGTICNGPAGECVAGCSTDDQRNDCPSDKYCSEQDGDVGSCIGQPCEDSDDCSGSTPVCDTSVLPNQCVSCVADSDCADPLICNGSNQCVECFSGRLENCSIGGAGAACVSDSCGCNDDSDCGATDSGRVCDSGTDQCIAGCRGTSGNDCNGILVCTSTDDTIGGCVTCTADAGCTAPEVCDETARECVECVADGDCTAPAVCDESANACVGCVATSDCTAPEVCDTSAQVCVGCVQDGDCPTDQICDEGAQACVGCTMTSDCDGGMICDTDSQTCVGCTMTSDCDGGMICDTDSQTCVGCTMTSDCDGGMICDTDSQTCVGCTMTSDCDGGMICDTDSQTCVGCTMTSDCDGGMICDTDSQTCVGCVMTSDCGSGMVCDTGSQTCVGCLMTSDCESGMVCDSGSQTCVGCTSNADCTAGSTCDTEQHACVAGKAKKESVEGGGCGCTVPGSSPASLQPLALAAAALLLSSRRRRARRAA